MSIIKYIKNKNIYLNKRLFKIAILSVMALPQITYANAYLPTPNMPINNETVKHKHINNYYLPYGNNISEDSGYYLKLGLGNSRCSTSKGFYNEKLGHSNSINIGFGGDFISNNRLELNFLRFDNLKQSGISKQNMLMREEGYATIKSETIMLNFYSDQYVLDKFIPYFGGGIGYTKNKINFTKKIFISEKFSNLKTASVTKKSFAWQVVAGFKLPVHKKIIFDISYRYSELGRLIGSPIMVFGNKSDSKLRTQEILFSILFKL